MSTARSDEVTPAKAVEDAGEEEEEGSSSEEEEVSRSTSFVLLLA